VAEALIAGHDPVAEGKEDGNMAQPKGQHVFMLGIVAVPFIFKGLM
jgi:hypothetical protein